MTLASTRLGLIDYINLAIRKNYLVNILITSSAEAKIPSLGFDYGTGKSTLMLNLLRVIWGNWERVKRNLVGVPSEIKPILDRPFRTLAWGMDDMQLTLGKDKQNDPDVKELAYYLTTVRPYYSVMLGTCPHRGMLQKDFREMFHFEVIVPVRGTYEVQQLKHWIDFKNPQKIKDRLRYKGQMIFRKLPPDMQQWYNIWRDEKNREIRKTIKLFQYSGVGDTVILNFEDLSEREKIVVQKIAEKGYISYFDTVRKGIIKEANILRTKGWLEQDRRRRWNLTIPAIEAIPSFAIRVPSKAVDRMELRPQVAKPLDVITFKKQVAETFTFQGLRVTESYGENEPDLVVWKDGTTPSEVIAVRAVSIFPAEIDVGHTCKHEIEFAQKYGFEKIRLVCFDVLKREKIYDDLVSFNEKLNLKGPAPEETEKPVSEFKEIFPSNKAHTLIFDKKFQTQPVELSERVIAVSDAFGIGVDGEKEFTIFDNLELKYNDGDLMYVTGDSGSGKSTFLRIFQQHEEGKSRKCANFDTVNPDPNEILINSIGKNKHEAMRFLGVVGLSEAFLMVRRYKELSDGQKYRYKLGKLIESNADSFLVDEFGAKLDREMAKTLAFCIQKWARRNKKTFIIATTHKDLIEDFNPDIIFDRKFGEQTQPTYYQPRSPPKFSLISNMMVEEATNEDYEQLKKFHYLHGTPPTAKRFKLTYKGDVIGVILYSPPFLAGHYRNKMFPEYKNNPRKVNAEILRISRIIVHPKFRGVGLAQQLVKLTLPMVQKRIVETIAVMANYNPFFEKAGMKFVGKQKFTRQQQRYVDFVEELDANIGLLQDHTFRKGFLNKLSSGQLSQFINILENLAKGMRGVSTGRAKDLIRDLEAGKIEKTMVKLMPVERYYLYWLNPNWQA